MEKRFFRYKHYYYVAVYSYGIKDRFGLWAYRDGEPEYNQEKFYFLGYFKDGQIVKSSNLRKLPWTVSKGAERMYDMVMSNKNHQLAFGIGEAVTAVRVRRRQISKRPLAMIIVGLRDQKGWSFQQIADHLGISAKSTVYEMYKRTKARQDVRAMQ